MAPQTFLPILALFLALTVQVSAQEYNYSDPHANLQDCVNYVYPLAQKNICTLYKKCHANICDAEFADWYDYVADACELLPGGDVDKVIHAKCKAGSKPHAGAIAGGVIGGLAGVASVGVIGVIAYHMLFSAIPALTHLGIAGAGAGAAGAAKGASQGASSAAKGAAVGHAAHAAHTGHAADAHHAATAGQAGTQGGTQMAQHGAGVTSAGHNLGTGSAPYTSDGGASHAIGQAQAPIGTDGGSTMSGGQSFSPGQSFGPTPAHGYGPGSPAQGVSPNFTGSGASGQGYIGPNLPPVGSDGGASQAAAGSGYSPTTTAIPSPSPSSSTPFPGAPFGPPNTPHFERTRWSLFGQSRKSIQDEENQRLASQSQMVQMPTLPSFPGSPVSTAASFSPQPAIVVGGPQVPLQPSSSPIGVPLQTSIQYTAAQPRFPSDNKYGA